MVQVKTQPTTPTPETWEKLKKLMSNIHCGDCESGPDFCEGIYHRNDLKIIEDFIRKEIESARWEERERITKILSCWNCAGTGDTNSLDGAMECVECGGSGHLIQGKEDEKLSDLLTPPDTQ